MPTPTSTRPVHGGNLAWAAQLAGCSPSDLLDFSASINPLGPPATAIAAIHAHLKDLRDYPDPEYRQLRFALSQFHDLDPDWILPGNGAAELITWASRELAALDAAHLLAPAFSDYLRSLRAFNAQIVLHPLLNEGVEALRGTGQLGLLLNNPHNPTGRLFRIPSILPLLDQFALVVIDEAFMDFLPPDQQQSLIDQVPNRPNLVILRSLTKFYSLAGLRLGYAIAHPDRLQRWQQWRDPWSVNVLAAAAGAAAVQDTEFQRQTWEWLAVARPQLLDGLAALWGLQPLPSAANYLLVKSSQSTVEVQRRLLQHRILIRDCISFAELGDRYFRVAVRTLDENQRLLDGLATVLSDLSC